ncbi:MAG TPA: Lpg1974 family pore-forming outer membrane protein [Planctomycetaceae bacterium]|nr:Lpg1974 family pore-forming outer membrane protein [Planctomycetaceae bacterium]
MKIPVVPLAAAGLALTLSMTAQSVAQYHPYAPQVRPYRSPGAVSEPGPFSSLLSSDTDYVSDTSGPPPAPPDAAGPPPAVKIMPPDASGWTGQAPAAGPCPQYFCEPCQCDCFCGGWFGGFEFAWLRPRFSDNTAIVVDPPDGNVVLPFDYDFETTPRVWLGYVNEDGFGVQARYWQFDGQADSRTFSPDADNPLASVFVALPGSSFVGNAFAGIGETFVAEHDLELHVLDLEMVQRWQWRRMLLLGSLGARYVRMDQEFQGTALTAAGVIDEMIRHDHSFEGFGPVAGLQIIRPLGQRGFGVYGNIRGSILFGDQDVTITQIKLAGADVQRHTRSGDEVLAIGEIGFGVQYARTLRNNAEGFVRFGYESQIWWDAGGPINTDGNMGLEGFALSFGVYR